MCKRFISLILTAALVLSLGVCACSKSEETTKKKKKVKKTTTTEAIDTDDTDLTAVPSDPDDPTDKTDPTDPSDPTSPPVDVDTKKVGISLPTKDLRRWVDDGDNMKKHLEADGYVVMLNYAANDIYTQRAQISDMVNCGCQVIVVAPIDGYSLNDSLDEAEAAGIPVIAYDRLIYGTDTVDYYVSFDNYGVGVIQGEYICASLDLDNSEGPFTMEIFTGDPGDFNAQFFFNGALSVLQPYIDSGKLVVISEQTTFEQCATPAWRTDEAQSRMDAILSTCYSDGTDLDAVLCSNDSTALGVENSLEANYTGKYPVITGQDCDIANVKNMLRGLQAMSIFKDTRIICDRTVKMVSDIIEGRTPEINDDTTYNNGVKNVPAYLETAIFCTIDNYKEVLIDSGYYTEDMLS